jgi:hypothetical protein
MACKRVHIGSGKIVEQAPGHSIGDMNKKLPNSTLPLDLYKIPKLGMKDGIERSANFSRTESVSLIPGLATS